MGITADFWCSFSRMLTWSKLQLICIFLLCLCVCYVCMWKWEYILQRRYGSQKSAFGNEFFPSTTWVLGIKLRVIGRQKPSSTELSHQCHNLQFKRSMLTVLFILWADKDKSKRRCKKYKGWWWLRLRQKALKQWKAFKACLYFHGRIWRQ